MYIPASKKIYNFVLAFQWIEDKNGVIKNKATQKSLCAGVCKLPKYLETGYIKDGDKVMTLKDGMTLKGTEVTLEAEIQDSKKQHWKRSRPTKDGFFSLQSALTDTLYLHSGVDGKLTNGVKGILVIPNDTPKGILIFDQFHFYVVEFQRIIV